MLESGEITIHEFNAAIRHRKGPCPKNCPGRSVYCKRDCKIWADHVALSQRIYELRDKYANVAAAEARHRVRVMKIGQR